MSIGAPPVAEPVAAPGRSRRPRRRRRARAAAAADEREARRAAIRRAIESLAVPRRAIVRGAAAVRRLHGADRPQPAGRLSRDVPRLVRDLVLVPEHAAAGGAADADGAGDGAAAAPRAGRARRRGRDGAGRPGRRGGRRLTSTRRCRSRSAMLVDGRAGRRRLAGAGAGALRASAASTRPSARCCSTTSRSRCSTTWSRGRCAIPASLNKPSTLPIGDDNMLGNAARASTSTGAWPGGSARAFCSGSSWSGRRSASPRAWWAATCARRC